MRLTLTFTNETQTQMHDVQVNPQQKIKDTLDILMSAGVMDTFILSGKRVKSLRRGMFIPTEITYEAAQLFSGDILVLY